MTAAAQLETTFAGAERAERQCRTGRRNVGRTRQLGLPAAPGEAGEQGARGHRSAPELAPPAGECSGDAAAVNTPVAPVASHAGAQAPGAGHAGHAGALLPRPELNGHDSPSPAPSCDRAPVAAPVAGAVAGPAAPSSDEGPAPQLLPPADLPASAPVAVPVPVPVAAPSESLRAASLAPESFRDDPFAGLSPGPSSAAPLLHPAAPARVDRAGRRDEHPPGRRPAGRRRSRGGATARHAARRGARPLHLEGEHRPGVRTGTAPAEGSAVAPRPAHVVGRPGGAPGARGGGAARPARRRQRAAGGGEAPAARARHRGGRRTRHVLPGQRPRRLSAQANPRGGRRTGHVSPRRRRPRLGEEAAILRRRRATAPLPEGRTRAR